MVFRETHLVYNAPHASTFGFSTFNAICEYPANNTVCGAVFDLSLEVPFCLGWN